MTLALRIGKSSHKAIHHQIRIETSAYAERFGDAVADGWLQSCHRIGIGGLGNL